MQLNLLHLSDLHFGPDHSTAQAQRTNVLDQLIKELGKLDDDWKPNLLAISGDLACKGNPEGYTQLATWLKEKLFPATGLTPADCVICPGNHDINRQATRSLLSHTDDSSRADDVLDPTAWEDGGGFAAPFKAYVEFAKSFGIPALQLQGKPNYLAGQIELQGIQFTCLNSAWFCRNSETDRSRLWIGLPQLQSLPPFDEDAYDTQPISIALLHHPSEWLADPENNAYEPRANTYGTLAARSHAILSGHTHGAIENATRLYNRAWLFLSGAGYESSKSRNNFSILQINTATRHITRRPWELDPRKCKWELKPSQGYSLLSRRPQLRTLKNTSIGCAAKPAP